jgi:hypothetical protein
VTGFTTQGEEEEGVLDTIKSWDRPTIEASAASLGAKCRFCSPVHGFRASFHLVQELTFLRCRSPRTLGQFYPVRWPPGDRSQPRKRACHRRGLRPGLGGIVISHTRCCWRINGNNVALAVGLGLHAEDIFYYRLSLSSCGSGTGFARVSRKLIIH